MKKPKRTPEYWHQRYLEKDTPWVREMPLPEILDAIERYTPEGSKILEIGCGTGTEAIAAAKMGFKVTGSDHSPKAIEVATQCARQAGVKVEFVLANELKIQEPKKFDVVYDISCLHTYSESSERKSFARMIADQLTDEGIWIDVACINPLVAEVEQHTGIQGPPSLTLKEIAEATEEQFILIELKMIHLPIARTGEPVTRFPAWLSVFKKL